jgi:hypothetical protein
VKGKKVSLILAVALLITILSQPGTGAASSYLVAGVGSMVDLNMPFRNVQANEKLASYNQPNGLATTINQVAEATCLDSDGGQEFEVVGYVEGVGPNGWPFTKNDVCESEDQLREFYCNGTTPWPVFYDCPLGCVDGACVPETCTDNDGDGYAIEGGGCGLVDCNDDDASINPGATEVCDNDIDDDCDGLIDDADADCATCTDADGDGYAVEGDLCGLVDCDDTDANVNPGAMEVCDNGIDDDCDGFNDGDDADCGDCFDSDGGINFEVAGIVDGVGPNGWPQTREDVCEISGTFEGYLREYYCNGSVPWPTFYDCPNGCADGACIPETCTDDDGDGYAIEGGGCGLVDCDDGNADVNPGATEVCDNGIDDDCNGLVDGDDPACLLCTDADGDGYAIEGGACGLVDCDDGNADVNPGATEVCDNGIDDDCNGLADDADPFCSGPSDPKNIIVIGWDGTQRDHFWQCYNKELPECANGLPNIQALSGGTIYDNTTTNGDTSTKPGWAQILTGYNAEYTGIFSNGEYAPIPLNHTVFEKVEDHFGDANVVTMFISGKAVNTGDACVGEETTCSGSPCIEDQGQPWCLVSDHLDYYENNLRQNQVVGNRALELLNIHQNDLFLAFVLFREPDVIGHLAGEDSENYSRSIIDVDFWTGEIMNELSVLGIADRTFVYVTTDHGFDEGDNRHGNAPYGMFASNDSRIMRSGDRRDIAPTILEHFGISRGAIGGAPAVNGYSLFALPPISCVPEGEAFVDYPGAPVCCAGLDLITFDFPLGSSTCVPPTGGTGDNSGYCTDCGDGVCTAPENRCNCPADC